MNSEGKDSPNMMKKIGNGEHILFVDDEEFMASIMERMLKGSGFEVTLVTSGQEALDLFKAGPEKVKLLITDRAMPEMSGLELTRAVHEIRPELPVVLMSGYLRSGDAEEMKEAGVNEYVEKPASLAAILEAVQRALNFPQR